MFTRVGLIANSRRTIGEVIGSKAGPFLLSATTPYVITNIWLFPDSRMKLRAKMTEDPHTSIEEDDAEGTSRIGIQQLGNED